MSLPRRRALRIESDKVIDDSGVVHDVRLAIAEIPWVTAIKYEPNHQYITQGRCPVVPWEVLSTFVRHHPESYLAIFRGYKTPNRYMDLDGRRYWMTSSGGRGGGVLMLNRCLFTDSEPPRRLDQGAKPRLDWSGPPWMPDGSPWPPWYQPGPDGVHRYVASLDPYRGRRRQ